MTFHAAARRRTLVHHDPPSPVGGRACLNQDDGLVEGKADSFSTNAGSPMRAAPRSSHCRATARASSTSRGVTPQSDQYTPFSTTSLGIAKKSIPAGEK